MSKNFRDFQKKNPSAPETRFREEVPQVNETKAGRQLLCPYCTPSHPLEPGKPNACGTLLKVTAVQMIYTKKAVMKGKMVCAKCHEGGGEMVQYMQSYVHIPDCKPDTFLLPELPTFSRLAGFVYGLKNEKLKKWFEEKYGMAQQVQDMDKNGEKTGKVLGYFFLKVPKAA